MADTLQQNPHLWYKSQNLRLDSLTVLCNVHRCWKTMMRISRVSVFQQDVSDVVAALQIEHQMEYLAQDGLFSVDVAILSEGKSIAIEVDGPFHYTLNTHQPLGHTLLR